MGGETTAAVRKARGACIVDVSGDVTSFSESTIKGAWAEAVAAAPRQIVLNFQKVQYMNSAGIAILIDLVAEARRTQTRVSLVWHNEHFEKILKMVGLTRYLTVYSSEAEALSAD